MTDDVIDLINIPKERIAVLIGEKGIVKRRIEKLAGVKIQVDSENGEVAITRKTDGDLLAALKAQDIIKAIARGFSPQKAFKLTSPNVYLEIIDLTEYVPDKHLPRIRARLIGEGGKARNYISDLTKADISIFGKTVGIIGDETSVGFAKEAILRLVEGKSHATVFRYVERHRD